MAVLTCTAGVGLEEPPLLADNNAGENRPWLFVFKDTWALVAGVLRKLQPDHTSCALLPPLSRSGTRSQNCGPCL
jgi:hypothetical protein